MEQSRLFWIGLVLMSLATVIGCSEGAGDMKAAEQDYAALDAVVSRVSPTAATEPEQFDLLFVNEEGPNKDDRKVFLNKTIRVKKGDCNIEGNTATAKVTVEDPNTEEVIGQIEWTFERLGDKEPWQIKTSPMP